MIRRSTYFAWAAVAAFLAGLLVIALGPHRIGAFDAESDFYGGYAPAAASLQHGRWLDASGKLPQVFGFVGPLYPVLLALVGSVGGDLFGAAEAISVFAAVAAVACWLVLLRRRVSAPAALAITLLMVTNPVLARYGYSVTTDATSLALQSAAICLLFAGAGDAAALIAGVLAGLAMLTRYTGVYLLPAALVGIAMGATLHPRRARAALLFVAGFMALALLWQVYARTHGVQVQFHQLFAYDVYGSARGVRWDDFLARIWPRFEHAPLAVFTEDPGAVVGRLVHNIGDHLRLDLSRLLGWPVAVAAVLGALLAWRDGRVRRLGALALPGAWAFSTLVPAPHSERYSLAMLPYYLLPACALFSSAAWHAEAGKRRWRAATGIVLLCVVAATSLFASVREQLRLLEQQPLETLACAERLRQLARPGDRVIARKPNLAFHAGVGAVYFPETDSLEALAGAARANGARWLFVSPAEVLMRPRTAFLLDTTATIPGLTLRAWSSVPMRLDRTLLWNRGAALYEIGPAFGTPPDWFGSDTLKALHQMRGTTATNPDARMFLRLAYLETVQGNPDRARAAWRQGARIDPAGFANLVGRFGGDTLQAVMRGQSYIR